MEWRRRNESKTSKEKWKEDKFTQKSQHFWWRNLSLLMLWVLCFGLEVLLLLISCIALYLRATFDLPLKRPSSYDEHKLLVFAWILYWHDLKLKGMLVVAAANLSFGFCHSAWEKKISSQPPHYHHHHHHPAKWLPFLNEKAQLDSSNQS